MPELTQYGILPPGIHEMDMEEVSRLFCGVPSVYHRSRLFENLEKYVKQLQTFQIGTALIVDGSFVMACVEKPADIDIVLVMPKEWDNTIETIPPEHYNLLSPLKAESEFAGIHLFVVAENTPLYHDWIRWLSIIKGDWRFMFDVPQNESKGLVRVTL